MHHQRQWSIYLGVGHDDPSSPTLSHFHFVYKEPGLFTTSPLAPHRVSVLAYSWALHTQSLAPGTTLSRISITPAGSSERLAHCAGQPVSRDLISGLELGCVCVTLSCSQGFPLPSPHPGFTSGIGPARHNRSQGDSKVWWMDRELRSGRALGREPKAVFMRRKRLFPGASIMQL